jgi:hypothetical protein
LSEEIRSLMRAIDSATARPTASQMLRLGELKQEVADAQNTYEKLLSGEIAKINEMVKDVP